jgi:hypothetical protein
MNEDEPRSGDTVRIFEKRKGKERRNIKENNITSVGISNPYQLFARPI